MGQRIVALVICAALAGCGSQADKQLEAVKAARSVLAEWALVEERNSRDMTPQIYVEQMREKARDQLKTAEVELQGQPQAAAVIARVRTGAPDRAALQQADKALQPVEDSLESA